MRQIILTLGLLASVCFGLAGSGNADELSRTSASEPVNVTTDVSKSAVQVADPLTFELTVTAPAGAKVVLPAVSDRLGDFDVMDRQTLPDIPSAHDTDHRIWTWRLTLESIVTGDLTIPPVEIRVSVNGNTQVLTTDAIPVRVISVLEDRADPTQFRDIRSVVDVDVRQPESRAWLWWTAAGFGGLAIATAIAVAVTKRRTWMTPDAWAIGQLEQLRSSESVETADSESVSHELTSILRDYLEMQFEISAPAQSTDELLRSIAGGQHLSDETTAEFARLFDVTDQARFAGLQLTSSELTNAVDEAQRLVEKTAGDLHTQTETKEAG